VLIESCYIDVGDDGISIKVRPDQLTVHCFVRGSTCTNDPRGIIVFFCRVTM
jgi:polygalacturonase